MWSDTTTVFADDFLEQIRRLKASDAPGELQVPGSVRLARTMHEAGLIDAYRVVAPVLVAKGSGVIAGSGPASTMTVVQSTVTAHGCFATEMVTGPFVNDLTAAVEDGQDVIRDVYTG